MMLINSSNVEHFKISSHGLIKVSRKDRPEEYSAVKGPIKVKLDKDLFVVVDIAEDEYGGYRWDLSVLNSTKRKFNMDYVNEIWNKQFSWSKDSDIIWSRTAKTVCA